METTIQFIQTTPEQLQKEIIAGVRLELDKLKADFQTKEPTEYMTRDEVKKMFQVDLSTIFNWTRKGKLKSYGLGNRVYYRRDEVLAAIKPLV